MSGRDVWRLTEMETDVDVDVDVDVDGETADEMESAEETEREGQLKAAIIIKAKISCLKVNIARKQHDWSDS